MAVLLHVLTYRPDLDAPRPVCCPDPSHQYEAGRCEVCRGQHWTFTPLELELLERAKALRVLPLTLCLRCRLRLTPGAKA